MRQLIDVGFVDLPSYSQQVGQDVGAIVIDHEWGPYNELVSCDRATFLANWPLLASKMTDSWVTAYNAFLAGLQTIEVVRLQASTDLFAKFSLAAVDPTGENPTPLAKTTMTVAEKEAYGGSTDTPCVIFKYPGNPAPMCDPTYSNFTLSVVMSKVAEATVHGDRDVTITFTCKDVNDNTIILEKVTGGLKEGSIVDGQDWYIGTRIKQSKYFDFLRANGAFPTVAETFEMTFTFTDFARNTVSAKTAAALTSVYDSYFYDIETSDASIIIDPATTVSTEAGSLISLAASRTDIVALIGYPVTSTWDKASIESYKQSLTANMNSAFYACRQSVTLNGYTYILNGIGTIAGDFANVANQASVNQLPSARAWGAFGGVITKTLTFQEVLELQEDGVNCVYQTATGPRIFGVRSLHPRATSYYSKFNVSRVCARILKYAFVVAMDVIHTGNTDNQKKLVQNLLSADLTRLKGQGALRKESTVQCNEANNQDIDTNGGEILIIDYTCYFVKLIEKVKIRITATDNSVSASIK